MNYLDANFATALHFNIRGQTELAERFLRRNSLPVILSELAELECYRAFIMRTGRLDSENWSRMQGLIASGIWRREPVTWSTTLEKTRQLMARYGTRLKAGTLDTLHVAQALLFGCTRFLSFDTNSNARVLAGICQLQVYPELSAAEKARIIR